jgi:hypothetical protein
VTILCLHSTVMLSGAGVQRSGTPAQSKHPYQEQPCMRDSSRPLEVTAAARL